MPKKMKPLLAIATALPDTELGEAVKEIIQFTDTIPSQDLGDLEVRLAADYARLFLSINKIPPHPSESTYRDGTMMQYARDEVLRTYWSFGVDKKKEFTEPEDHIAVELGFIMYLCEKTIEALNNGDAEEARRYLQGQKDFLEKHLIKWLPKLVEDILNTGQTPFYKAIAVLTRTYIEMDLSATEDLLEQVRG
ncbi:molecular chaperone [Chloroflexota bacterium]